ncbi:MAG TPA: sugar phosphate isomerase/epimerase family protein [Bryobacteraceae bacterium]|nr:sugar phosphate isomerase/epimerase family protein [Bryobacteraceae bacterium]
MTRRDLLKTAATVAAAPAILMAKSSEKLPIAVSTLGCPKWDWNTIVKNTSQWGFAALELRGIQDQMDLPKCAEFSGTRLQGTMKDLSAVELKISDLGASAQMHEPDPAKRAAHMDEARRFIDLAHQLHTPYVRVFPNQFIPGEDKKVTIDRISSGLHELGEYANGSGVTVIVESHGEFRRAEDLTAIINGAKSKNVAFLWDAHHTCIEGEKPADTFERMGKLTRHTHLKDSVPIPGNAKEDPRYVLTGTGKIPVKEIVRVLATGGYKGYYCFEWEKRWHPDIEEPEVSFPHYAKTMREYLADAGVKA